MQFTKLALYLGVALAVSAPAVLAAPSEVKLCGSHETAPATVEEVLGNKIAAARAARTSNSLSKSASAAAISASIPVYYHFITDVSINGKISSIAIANQISILNDNYAIT